MAHCVQCQGLGYFEGEYLPCSICNGRGDNGMRRDLPCQACHGSGKAIQRRRDPCWNCHGTGRVADPKQPSVPSSGKGGSSRSRPGKGKPGKGQPPKPGPEEEQINLMDKAGLVLAAAGAVAAGLWAHNTFPDKPLVWFICGLIGAVFAFGLRKLILGVAVAAGGLWLIFGQEDEERPAQVAGTVPVPVQAAPAAAAPAQKPINVIGFCLVNEMPAAVSYIGTIPGNRRGDTKTVAPGSVRTLWIDAQRIDPDPEILDLDLGSELGRFDVPLSSYLAEASTVPDALRCGEGGLREYVIKDGTDGPGLYTR